MSNEHILQILYYDYARYMVEEGPMELQIDKNLIKSVNCGHFGRNVTG